MSLSSLHSLSRYTCIQSHRRLVLSLHRPRYFSISGSSASNLHLPPKDALERIKHPTRGGRNLTARYKRLEKSLRSKTAPTETTTHLHDVTTSTSAESPLISSGLRTKNVPEKPLFHGFEVPEEPRPPESDECCMSGCAICVYDLYEESMISYKESVAALQVSLEKLKIPESEWPQHIQRNIRLEAKNTSTPNGAAKSVTLSAFEELERRLQEKQNGGDAQATHSIHQEAIKSANRRGKGAPTIDTVKEVYEGLQWVLLSNR